MSMTDSEKLRFIADWHDRQSMRTIPEDYIKDLRRIADTLEKAPSDEEIDVELALKINVLVHNECKDVPHDIGLRIAAMVSDRYKALYEYAKSRYEAAEKVIAFGFEPEDSSEYAEWIKIKKNDPYKPVTSKTVIKVSN